MNRYQEALNNIKNMGDKDLYNERHLKWAETLQQLVDKEAPKKVKKEIIGYASLAGMPELPIHKTTCPICDKELCYKKYNYCPDCGQALDKE